MTDTLTVSPRVKEAASICEALNASCDYSDYIAHRISKDVRSEVDTFIRHVGRVIHDLHPTGGYLQSSRKRVEIADRNGHRYVVTVERVL